MKGIKLFTLSLLLTGCSVNSDQVAESLLNNPGFEAKLKTSVSIKFNEERARHIDKFNEADERCKRTAQCLKQPTYLQISEWGAFHCMLVKNNRVVQCYE